MTSTIEMYIKPSCSMIVLAQRKLLLRSPYQSRTPDTKKSTANDAVSAAFSF